MNKNRNRDVWIGIISLIIIGGFGTLFLVGNSQPSPTGDNTATTTTATTSASLVQGPQTVNRSAESVISIAENITGATEFSSLLANSGVAALVKGPGPYTIFVPTNTAFSQLPPGTISGLSAAGKKRLVEYSIVSGRAIDVTAQVAGTIQALSRDALNFSFGADNIPMVNSAILIKKYRANNGVVYLIDNVLVPPSGTTQQQL